MIRWEMKITVSVYLFTIQIKTTFPSLLWCTTVPRKVIFSMEYSIVNFLHLWKLLQWHRMYVVVFQYLSIIWTGTEIQLHMLYAIATAYD